MFDANKVVIGYANPGLLPSGKKNPYAPQAQSQAPASWGGVDPTKALTGQYSGTVNQAWDGLGYAAQKGWGKTLSEQDKARLAKASGYQSGNVNQDQYNKALAELGVMYGEQPGQTPEGTPPPKLGPENAIDQWKQQAPVAGVPQSFRGTNPYYAQQQQLMSKILANPQTMGQQQQNQLNEQQKESALRMQKQVGGQANQMLAGRGFGAGGGTQQALQQQMGQDTMNQILGGRRDTALKAAQINRGDELNALNASQGLAGQEWDAQMGLSAMNLGQMNQNRQASLQEFLGTHSADMDVLGFEENKSQFNKGFGLDFLRYLAQKDQFGQSLGENQRQYNNQMGFNWAGMNADQQNKMMQTIMGWF